MNGLNLREADKLEVISCTATSGDGGRQADAASSASDVSGGTRIFISRQGLLWYRGTYSAI